MTSLIGRAVKAISSLRGRTVALVLPVGMEGKPVYEVKTFANFVEQGYRKNEVIFACIEADGDTASSVTYRVYAPGTDEEIADHPVRQLLQRPNPHMTEFDFLRLTRSFLKLAGKAYWEKSYNSRGELVALWPLRPDWVVIIPDSKTWVRAYRYSVPGAYSVDLPPENVLCIRNIDPLDMYRSLPPVQVAARVGEIDNSTTDYLKLFFERGTMPPGILKTTQKLRGETEFAEVKRRWTERTAGYAKWTDIAVLDQDFTYEKLTASFQEMQFDALDRRAEIRICQAMRVPPIMIGAGAGLDASTYSNYEQARKAWWQDVIVPSYKKISDALTNQLGLEFGVDIKADTHEVIALREDEDAKWTRMHTAVTDNVITVNEAREMIGFEPRPDCDQFLRDMAAPPPDLMGDQVVNDVINGNQPDMQARQEEAMKNLTPITPAEIAAARAHLKAEYGFDFSQIEAVEYAQ